MYDKYPHIYLYIIHFDTNTGVEIPIFNDLPKLSRKSRATGKKEN
jgi:hypothetical protein